MLDRTIPPPFNRSTSFDLIQPEKFTLPNGAAVYFVNGGGQEVLKIDFIFNSGRWFEKQWGLSHFTSTLLTKGTFSKNSFEIAEIFDRYGAHIEIAAGLDTTTLSLYSLTHNLDPVLNLLLEILNGPTFPEKELAQSRSIFLQNLKVNQEKTSFQASRLIKKNIFGPAHPYGKELDERDVSLLEASQLKEFYQKHFLDFQVVVSGRVDDHIQRQLINAISSLRYSKTTEKITAEVTPGNRHEEVSKEGSVQVSVRMGKRSLLRTDENYYDVLFLNHIFGGFFGSRLMKNIREEKGLTYGIYSSLQPMKNDSYMVIGADVNKENRTLIFDEIRSELKRLRTELISDEELDVARYHFIGSLQAEITTPFAHADKIKTILIYSLDPLYYTNMIERIDAVSAEELMKTAAKYFHEDSFFETAAG